MVSGTITDVDTDFECGFVKVKGVKKEVFFNRKTDLRTATLSDLQVGDKVKIAFEETSRGPLANTLILSTQAKKRTSKPGPEPSL